MIFPTTIPRQTQLFTENRNILSIFMVFSAILMIGCSFSAQLAAAESDRRPVVVVSLGLFAEIVQDIAGRQVEVRALVSPARDPHHYALRPSDLEVLRRADAILWMGPSLEPQLTFQVTHANNQQLAIEDIEGLNWLSQQGAHHDIEEHHSHHVGQKLNKLAMVDSHIWLSISNRAVIIEAITNWLLPLIDKPLQREALLSRGNQLLIAWNEKSELWLNQVAGGQATPLVVYHNAYQYLLTDLNIPLAGVIQPQHEVKPSIKHLLRLKKIVAEQKVGCVLVSAGSNRRFVEKIGGGTKLMLIEVDPLLVALKALKSEEIARDENHFASIQTMNHIIDKISGCTLHGV